MIKAIKEWFSPPKQEEVKEVGIEEAMQRLGLSTTQLAYIETIKRIGLQAFCLNKLSLTKDRYEASFGLDNKEVNPNYKLAAYLMNIADPNTARNAEEKKLMASVKGASASALLILLEGLTARLRSMQDKKVSLDAQMDCIKLIGIVTNSLMVRYSNKMVSAE